MRSCQTLQRHVVGTGAIVHLVTKQVEQVTLVFDRLAERTAQREWLHQRRRTGNLVGTEFFDAECHAAFRPGNQPLRHEHLGDVVGDLAAPRTTCLTWPGTRPMAAKTSLSTPEIVDSARAATTIPTTTAPSPSSTRVIADRR
jgi:hypothetical protein